MIPYYSEDGITIYHGDCREVLPELAPAELVLTDPPYGIGALWSYDKQITGRNGTSRLWGQGEPWDDATPEPETIALAVNAGHRAIVWGGNYFNLPPSRCWLVWDKLQQFSGSSAELAWTNLELNVATFRLSRIDAWVNHAESPKAHPTEKPIGLMRWCLELGGGESVVDPFMGSGTTLRAAKDLGRTAIGIEKEERYCEIAVARLAQGVLAL